MKSEQKFLPNWANNIALTAVLVFALALPAVFYYHTNQASMVTTEDLNFEESHLLAHVDLCQVTDDHILVKGWAFIVEENLNSPTSVYIETNRGNWLNLNSRVIPRPDVNEHFDIHYRNSALGFAASTSIPSEEITPPTRVVLTKNSSSGQTYGAYYACQG